MGREVKRGCSQAKVRRGYRIGWDTTTRTQRRDRLRKGDRVELLPLMLSKRLGFRLTFLRGFLSGCFLGPIGSPSLLGGVGNALAGRWAESPLSWRRRLSLLTLRFMVSSPPFPLRGCNSLARRGAHFPTAASIIRCTLGTAA